MEGINMPRTLELEDNQVALIISDGEGNTVTIHGDYSTVPGSLTNKSFYTAITVLLALQFDQNYLQSFLMKYFGVTEEETKSEMDKLMLNTTTIQ
jgi:hypothetical protein